MTAAPNCCLAFQCNESTSKNGFIRIPYNPVFLARNLKRVGGIQSHCKKRELKSDEKAQEDASGSIPSDVTVINGLSARFSQNNMGLKFQANTEDVIVRKRQKIAIEQEFECEFNKIIKFKEFQEKSKPKTRHSK